MKTINVDAIASVILAAPAWAGHCLAAGDAGLRERAARELASSVCAWLNDEQMPTAPGLGASAPGTLTRA
jgi:hypothetical protein